MKKYIFVLLTAAFIFALSSCEERKEKKPPERKEMQKEKHEKRW